MLIKQFLPAGLFLLSLFFPFMSTAAQSDSDKTVPVQSIDTVMWAYDSQHLIYYDSTRIAAQDDHEVIYGTHLTQPAWCQYDLSTDTTSCEKIWPLYPNLTSAEVTALHPREYILPSPDDNLLFFAQNELDHGMSELMIANRQTGEVWGTSRRSFDGALPLPIGQWGNGAAWSKDGTGLAFSYVNPAGEVLAFYVNIPDENNLQTAQVLDFSLTVGGHNYLTFDRFQDRVHDISDDGDRVLLTGREFPSDYNFYLMPTQLIVWIPRDPEASLVLGQFADEGIASASFAPADETKLFVLTTKNLFLYDLLTGETDLLRSGFDLEAITPALFSPDGRWLVIQSDHELRFINMLNILPIPDGLILPALNADNLISLTYGELSNG